MWLPPLLAGARWQLVVWCGRGVVPRVTLTPPTRSRDTLQSQKAVYACLKREQIPPFSFVGRCSLSSTSPPSSVTHSPSLSSPRPGLSRRQQLRVVNAADLNDPMAEGERWSGWCTADTARWINDGLTLVQRRRRWTNVKRTSCVYWDMRRGGGVVIRRWCVECAVLIPMRQGINCWFNAGPMLWTVAEQ